MTGGDVRFQLARIKAGFPVEGAPSGRHVRHLAAPTRECAGGLASAAPGKAGSPWAARAPMQLFGFTGVVTAFAGPCRLCSGRGSFLLLQDCEIAIGLRDQRVAEIEARIEICDCPPAIEHHRLAPDSARGSRTEIGDLDFNGGARLTRIEGGVERRPCQLRRKTRRRGRRGADCGECPVRSRLSRCCALRFARQHRASSSRRTDEQLSRVMLSRCRTPRRVAAIRAYAG